MQLNEGANEAPAELFDESENVVINDRINEIAVAEVGVMTPADSEVINGDEPERSDDATRYTWTAINNAETTSDEGWQEANPKARMGQRKPMLSKLNISRAEYTHVGSRREVISSARKALVKTVAITEQSPQKKMNASTLGTGEDPAKIHG